MATVVQLEVRVDNTGAVTGLRTIDTAATRTKNNVVSIGSAGRSTASSLQSMGATGAHAMDQVGGHALTALDNVRLLRDDIGIRIPRSMEKVIAQSQVMMAAINAVGGTLLAVGSLRIAYEMGKEVYDLYEKWVDTRKAVRDYTEEAAKAAQQKLFDSSGFDSTLSFLSQANVQIAALQAKRKASDNTSVLDRIFLPHSSAPRFNTDDDKALAQAMTVSDTESMRALEETHKLMLQNIEDVERRQKAGADASISAAAEHRANIARAKENLSFEQQRQQQLVDVYNRAHQADPKKFPGTYKADVNAGQQEYSMALQGADNRQDVSNTEAAIQAERELLRIRQEANAVGLQGERALQAQRIRDLENLAQQYRNDTNNPQYLRQEQAINDLYDRRDSNAVELQNQDAARRSREASAKGVTGIAAIQARGDNQLAQVDQQYNNHEFYGDRDQQATYAESLRADARKGMNAETLQSEKQFSDQIDQLARTSADHQVEGFARIRSEGDRQLAELQKRFDDLYGGIKDKSSPVYLQGVSDLQRGRSAIQGGVAGQSAELERRNAEETAQLEAEANEKMARARRDNVTAIYDEYDERVRKYQDMLNRQMIGEQDFDSRVRSATKERDAELAQNARELRDKIAGEIEPFFRNPLQALENAGMKIASQQAANLIVGLGVGQGGSGRPDGLANWFGGRRGRGGANAPQQTASAVNDALHIGNATIYVGNARLASGLSSGAVDSVAGGAGVMSGGPGLMGGSMVGLPSDSATFGGSGVSSDGTFAPHSAGNAPTLSTSSVMTQTPAEAYQSIYGTAQSTYSQVGQAAQELGMKGDLRSHIPGLNKLSDNSLQKISGIGGGALGLFSAAYGSGGVGGALGGAFSGAKLGAEIGGPVGAAIGAVAGVFTGLIGQGARNKAEHYDHHTIQPRIAADLLAFQSGSSDYQSAYQDISSLQLEAKNQVKQFGSSAESYYNDTMVKEFATAQQTLTREQKAGRTGMGIQAGQFDVGGPINSFGMMSTYGDHGWVHAQRGEFVVQQGPAADHYGALQAIRAGASHADMADYYGANGMARVAASYRSTMANGSSSGSVSHRTVNMNVQALDSKSFSDRINDHRHELRRALNATYQESSGGSDL